MAPNDPSGKRTPTFNEEMLLYHVNEDSQVSFLQMAFQVCVWITRHADHKSTRSAEEIAAAMMYKIFKKEERVGKLKGVLWTQK